MGIFERDYVMRLVKQLVELIAIVLRLKGAGKMNEAVQALENGCLSLLGIPYSALALVDSKSAADLLSEPTRIAAFARLLEERAAIEEESGDLLAASARRVHALEVYLEALLRAPTHQAAGEGLERLRAKVPAGRLKPRYAEALLKRSAAG